MEGLFEILINDSDSLVRSIVVLVILPYIYFSDKIDVYKHMHSNYISDSSIEKLNPELTLFGLHGGLLICILIVLLICIPIGEVVNISSITLSDSEKKQARLVLDIFGILIPIIVFIYIKWSKSNFYYKLNN